MTDTSAEYAALIGEVRAELARRRWTDLDLARQSGIAQSTMSRRMNGVQPFTVPELLSVCQALDLSLSGLAEEAKRHSPPAQRVAGAQVTAQSLAPFTISKTFFPDTPMGCTPSVRLPGRTSPTCKGERCRHTSRGSAVPRQLNSGKGRRNDGAPHCRSGRVRMIRANHEIPARIGAEQTSGRGARWGIRGI